MAINKEYEKYMNIANKQNEYLTQSALGRQFATNPLQGYDLNALTSKELEEMIVALQNVYERKVYDTPLIGPTRRELANNEALKNAWEAYEIVKKLQGK